MSNGRPSLARLQELEVRLYKLTTKSHLAIGAGEAAELSPVDKPIIRALIIGEEERVPYIPASSLHGVIRAWVEKAVRSLSPPLAKFKEKFEGFESNHPAAATWLKQKVCADLDLPQNTSIDDLIEHWEVFAEVCNPFWEHDKCEYLVDEDSDRPNPKRLWFKHIGRQVPCEACCLFGHPGQRGRVRFTHAFPASAAPPLDVITRVAINRYTNAADPGKLFDLEAVPPGVVFHFFLILENLEEEAKGSLDWGLKALSHNLANLGGYGTVGFGLVELQEIRRVLLKPKIFTLKTIPDLPGDESYPWPADYDRHRYPQFFNFLARLTRNGALPEGVTPEMLEVNK